MLIDWFTVSAQIVNFLILVGLLQRFLYKPILGAVEEREKRIALQLADARAQKAGAVSEQDEWKRKNQELDRQREMLQKQIAAEAQSERQRLLDDARKEAGALQAKLHENLKNEQAHFARELCDRIRQEVFALTRKTLADLAGEDLEERMGNMFIQRLHNLKGLEKEKLGEVLTKSSHPVRIRSAFALPPAQRSVLQRAIKEILVHDNPVEFEIVPELIGGIEVSANGQKIAWSIPDYLASLKRNVDHAVEEVFNHHDLTT